MKAAVLETPGLEHLTIKDLPDPRPGLGEVLVRLRAASLNYRDWVVVHGGYGSQQKRRDLIPLSDGAGVVAELGPGVVGTKVGERVVGCFFPEWTSGEPSAERLAASLGGTVDGVASEYRVFPEHGLVPAPDYLTDVEAAALPCAALTAWNALVVLGRVAPGDVVLTQGTGGVAVFALQFARMTGGEVIATSSAEEKLARLRALGARHVISYAADREWGTTARTLTGGQRHRRPERGYYRSQSRFDSHAERPRSGDPRGQPGTLSEHAQGNGLARSSPGDRSHLSPRRPSRRDRISENGPPRRQGDHRHLRSAQEGIP